MHYLILQYSGHNWEYYQNENNLALAELKIASSSMDATLEYIKCIELAGIQYISFITVTNLTTHDLENVSQLSFVFALFSEAEHSMHALELQCQHYVG